MRKGSIPWLIGFLYLTVKRTIKIYCFTKAITCFLAMEKTGFILIGCKGLSPVTSSRSQSRGHRNPMDIFKKGKKINLTSVLGLDSF